ncbi:hypothetical protein ACH4YO_33840 [Streptomyces noursei]|uniref:hypothetical protein n=1 Tax=Streptomyces noursei TaxID=1971 RepID=UPI0037A5288C
MNKRHRLRSARPLAQTIAEQCGIQTGIGARTPADRGHAEEPRGVGDEEHLVHAAALRLGGELAGGEVSSVLTIVRWLLAWACAVMVASAFYAIADGECGEAEQDGFAQP